MKLLKVQDWIEIETVVYVRKTVLTYTTRNKSRMSATQQCFLSIQSWISSRMSNIFGELIYTCKMVLLKSRLASNMSFFPGLHSQPVHFSRFKSANLLLSIARFSGYNLGYNQTFLSGSNLQVQTWINIQVSPNNLIFQA